MLKILNYDHCGQNVGQCLDIDIVMKQLDSLYDSCDSLILTLTRDEAAESDVGPGLAVNSPLRDFNLRLKIMKNVNLKKT